MQQYMRDKRRIKKAFSTEYIKSLHRNLFHSSLSIIPSFHQAPKPYNVFPCLFNAYTTCMSVTVFNFACSMYTTASRMTSCKKFRKTLLISSYTPFEIRLTPPRRANRLIDVSLYRVSDPYEKRRCESVVVRIFPIQLDTCRLCPRDRQPSRHRLRVYPFFTEGNALVGCTFLYAGVFCGMSSFHHVIISQTMDERPIIYR